LFVFSRNTIGRCFRDKKQTNQLPDDAQLTTPLNHNYFVLEKHSKESGDNANRQVVDDQEHYALPKDPTYSEATCAEPDDEYDTTDQTKRRVGTPGKPGNVYNTFNDFQQQDDYDHLGYHKKPTRITENEYNTTQGAMATAIHEDTYNHLNKATNTATRPDNVYGMPRVDNDYDKMPPVGATHDTDGLKGGDEYSKIGHVL